MALLDLPPGSSLLVDGSTQIIRREDFVGICGVPPSGFHLVVVSSAGGPANTNTGTCTCTDNDDVVHGSQTTISTPSALHTTGFVLMRNASDGDNDDGSNHSDGWIVARRYDPQTEEICSSPPDGITCSNLQRSIQDGSIGPQRVVPYHHFIENQTNPDAWNVITSFISSPLLQMRGIASGEKIVPGAYEEDFDDDKRNVTSVNGEVSGRDTCMKAKDPAESTPRDGISICYPPIPCIEGSHIARSGHAGTKRYLSHLSPSDRTALFLDTEPGTKVLDTVLRTYYDGSWEELVGDVQLSFLLFLQLGCLSSFEHWRDTISMLSLVGSGAVMRHANLYRSLFATISCHLSSIERDFFEEVEYSGGNFFLPALNKFVKLCCECGGDNETLLDSVREIRQIVHSRFGIELVSISRGADTRGDDDDEEEDIMEVDVANGSAIDISAIPTKTDQGETDVKMQCLETSSDDDDVEDDDGPVIVTEADVEASLERSAVLAATQSSPPSATHIASIEEDRINRGKFPLIFAAMSPQEDILMCCARVLDEKNDVSLVREAAAYLEAVESKRH